MMRNVTAAAALCLALAGCFSLNFKLVPYVPDPATKGITVEKARGVLVETLGRAETIQGTPIVDLRVGEQVLHYRFESPSTKDRQPSERFIFDFDWEYTEVAPLIVEWPDNPPERRYVLSWKRGETYESGGFFFAKLEDAETVADAVNVLAANAKAAGQ